MRLTWLFGGAAVTLAALACSDSTGVQKANASNWSGAVIKVAASNPNAKGEVRGAVVALDSAAGTDLSKATPIPGATVVLNLKVTVQPASGNDTATTTVQKVGEVVTDANGRFLVSSIPEGDYYLEATPPASQPFYQGATWAFASSGSSGSDAVIQLPRKSTPPDSTGTGPVTAPPSNPPVDSL